MSQTNDPEIIKSIKKSYRVTNGPNVIRSSKIKYDLPVARFICSLGYDGFWAPKMKQKYGNKKFHQEIVLCHPKRSIRVVRVEQPSRPQSVAPKKFKRMNVTTMTPIKRIQFFNNNNGFNL
jgi:hypothetical protein